MIVLEPRVNEEKLWELLSFGTEAPTLDFKETCDLSVTRDRVELAKDVGAMQVDGGFIVVGADSAGTPTGRLTNDEAVLFDEARLRQILAKWIPAPFELLSGIHYREGGPMVVVYVAPSPKGLCIFKAVGQYGRQGSTTVVFREGDVFVRDGTQSRRWQQPDIDRILAKIVAGVKESWRAELTEDWTEVLRLGDTAQALARAPAQALTWQLDEGTFESVVIEQLRTRDSIPLRLLLERASADLSVLLSEGQADEAEVLLDRLACLASLGIRLDREDTFHAVLASMVAVYEVTLDDRGLDRDPDGPWSAERLRLEVIRRVMAVGAHATRRGAWAAVRAIALQTPEGYNLMDGFYTNWVRHAQVGAVRAGIMTRADAQGRSTEVGLLSLVLATASRLRCLHPDLPDGALAEDERLITSAVRFDVLAMLAVLGQAPGDRDYPYYPNFAGFNWHRFEPVLADLISDPTMRAEIYPGSDAELAADITLMLQWAAKEGRMLGGGGPLSNVALRNFLAAHDSG